MILSGHFQDQNVRLLKHLTHDAGAQLPTLGLSSTLGNLGPGREQRVVVFSEGEQVPCRSSLTPQEALCLLRPAGFGTASPGLVPGTGGGRIEPSWSGSDPSWRKDAEPQQTCCCWVLHRRVALLTPPTKNIFPTFAVKVLDGHSSFPAVILSLSYLLLPPTPKKATPL